MLETAWSFLLQTAVVFVVSTTLFDGLHYLLHRWRHSRFALLRTFSSWHQVHHDFLDKQMQVHPELKWTNIWAHLLPEYLTSILGTLVCLILFDVWPVLAICALHTVLFVIRIWTEGLDTHHMSMDRVPGKRNGLFVTPAYHALHHVHPLAFYSSFLNVFDMIFGTAIELRGKRVTITGATGALGRELADRLERLGARVTRVGRDLAVDFADTDILVLAHGSRGPDAVNANVDTFIRLGDEMIEAGRARLVPPEIWGVGSEAEILGFDQYATTKRAFADYAAAMWWTSPDVTYRHVVPAAFASKMGWGPMTAGFAAAWTLFLIRRGFMYVPVTWSGLALLNWFRFMLAARQHPVRALVR